MRAAVNGLVVVVIVILGAASAYFWYDAGASQAVALREEIAVLKGATVHNLELVVREGAGVRIFAHGRRTWSVQIVRNEQGREITSRAESAALITAAHEALRKDAGRCPCARP